MADASSLGWGRMVLAALAGSWPPALLYALTGAAVVNVEISKLMFGVVLVVGGMFWLIGRLFEPLMNRKESSCDPKQLGSDS